MSNPLFEEVVEETAVVDEQLEAALTPEVLTEEQVQELDAGALLQQLEVCKTRFVTLRPKDDLTAKQCAALAETCAFASRHAETRRTAITDPLNKMVKDTNLIWQPIVKGFADLARGKGAEVAKFIDDQRKEAERLQQKAIDDAKAEQDRLDRIAEEERNRAEQLRQEATRLEREEQDRLARVETDRLAAEQKIKNDAHAVIDAKRRGDEAATRLAQEQLDRAKAEESERLLNEETARFAAQAEQNRLNKLASKAENKSNKAELASENVVPTVVQQVSRTIDLGSSTLSTKAPKNIWILAGWDKQKPLRVTDPKLAELVGDLSKLPEGIQFLLKHADLNPVYLNKAYGVITFPKPFADAPDYGSSVRGKS